jgi:hypothetical protein
LHPNGCGDAELDGELGLIAREHHAWEDLQDGYAGAGRHTERDEMIESILHATIDAHNHAALAGREL